MSSKISAQHMKNILDKLKTMQHRNSSAKMYLCVWHRFNEFLIKLDAMPKDWEDRASLFVAHLIEEKAMQSSTVKLYISAIKKILIMDNYHWDNNRILVSALTKACRLINDRIRTRLPVQCGMLEMMLFEIERQFASQPYLEILYKAILVLGYYGLMCIGEMT